ncbi:RNA-directed DNA polymerase [Nocardia otitidiscaviarum]|uniref:RNA-directed DNA polymerase n=1 Tax=Nocardia otitidiscaviarum TaxID=1823 RepID=UPI0011DE2258|nr:RNA-directed DNA polymerase [Nocardia otitidiscaviarum]MBF6133139.1 RNA-directed DNA polymerase [Nocardia otitidiscaviarum]MBF6486535.1 RNA-directed DNA polymerase [Nocardia otitidiscaviarum]
MDRQILKLLELEDAATTTTATSFDHFPLLISDLCLSNDSKVLVGHTDSHWATARMFASETITMPKGRFGSRPIEILSTSAKTAYHAIATALKPYLPHETRAQNWSEHRRFGTDRFEGYLIDIDVASCYEYIDHQILHEEILLHSSSLTLSDAMISLLGGFMRNRRGLPQMLWASDVLADTYLSVIDRNLSRRDLSFHRYADDIRVLSKEWDESTKIVESLADLLRSIGLIPSDSKTYILKSESVSDPESEDRLFISSNFSTDPLAPDFDTILMGGPYGGGTDPSRGEPQPDADEFELALRIIENKKGLKIEGPMKWLSMQAMRSLRKRADSVPEAPLLDLVYKNQTMIEYVCDYSIARAANSLDLPNAQWSRLKALCSMPGEYTPWAKVWLLAAIESASECDSSDRDAVIAWALRQLEDRHETVRAQSAWSLAQHKELGRSEFETLYGRSTALTQHGLAAAASRQGGLSGQIESAVRSDSPLNKAAWEWAKQ